MNGELETSQSKLLEDIKEMIDDVIVSIQAAQAMADRFDKPYCILSDLSVHEVTEYTRERALEIMRPRRKDGRRIR